jgi:hypothetical protein
MGQERLNSLKKDILMGQENLDSLKKDILMGQESLKSLKNDILTCLEILILIFLGRNCHYFPNIISKC